MPSASIVSEVDKLASVLRLGTFHIPFYQRPYDWKPEHVETLLEDIADSIASNNHHFLGPIMYVVNEDNIYDINDGQQRIATFLLICAYLCKHFHDCGHTNGENQAMRMLFNIPEGHDKTISDADDLPPRVILSTNDKSTFESLTCGHPVRKNGKMNLAWKAIDKFFMQPKYYSKEIKQEFLHFLLNDLKVAAIKFGDASDSIAVFETQNNRGKSLEQIQLACTYFYSCLRNNKVKISRMHEKINDIRSWLNNHEDQFFNYARCAAQCEYGHLSTERFCRDIKKAISAKNAEKEVYSLVNNLSQRHKVHLFQNLARAHQDEEVLKQLTNDARQNKSHRQIMDYLKDLRKYGGVSNSIMFALLCQHANCTEKSERIHIAKFVYKSSKLLSSFFQRAAHSFPASFSPSQYEKGVADIAKSITNRQCKTANDFLAALHNLDKNNDIISDNLYKARMASIAFPSKIQDAKYILAKINEIDQKELVVRFDNTTTEHILPKGKIHIKKWEFADDEHALYVNRLGNLTLLSLTDNKPQAEHNDSFSNKKRIYAKSDYEITKALCDYPKWNKESIEERQAELAKLAALIWNFKID